MIMVDFNKKKAEEFYSEILVILSRSKTLFLIGGAYAVGKYTGIQRKTKDIDIFCKTGDYPKLIKILSKERFKIENVDPRWLAKVSREPYYADIIFGAANGLTPIDDTWFEHSQKANLFGNVIRLISPEELIWSKAYRQDRGCFDGADINHIILKMGGKINWQRLLLRMEPHWQLL